MYSGRPAHDLAPSVAKDFIGYRALTDSALRGVVRDALRRIGRA